MVIEDDRLARGGMVVALRRSGYQVLEAEDGASGLDLAFSQHPDLVLSDVNLPRQDGKGSPPGAPKGEALPLGSRLLKILTDLAQRQAANESRARALDDFQSCFGVHDPALICAVREYYGLALPKRDTGNSEIFIPLLRPGRRHGFVR